MSESQPTYEDIFDARGHLYNEAVSQCPGAREAERAALLDRLDARLGQVIGDAPAGGEAMWRTESGVAMEIPWR